MVKRLPKLIAYITLIFLLFNVLSVRAENNGQIGLVVQFGDGTVVTRCIDGDGLTGHDVLAHSGLEVIASFSNAGSAICKIGVDGCSEDHCFCQHPPNYWSYWQMRENAWVYSQMGASDQSVSAGSVEGWRWGEGDPPPVITFETICRLPPTEPPTASSPSPTETLSTPPTATVPPPPSATQPPLPTATVPPQPAMTSTAAQSTPTQSPDSSTGVTMPGQLLASSTAPASMSETPAVTPSPPSTIAAPATASDIPSALAKVELTPDESQPESVEMTTDSHRDQQKGVSPGRPMQYLFFGIITMLLGGILMVLAVRLRKA